VKSFSGFAEGKVKSVRLPSQAFTELVPLIDDLDELKVTLHVFWLLSQDERGEQCEPSVRHSDLAADSVLLAGLGERPAEALQKALERAVERGTLLRPELAGEGSDDPIYFANTPKGRAAVEGLASHLVPGGPEGEGPNIFTLYEENIGMLTPLIADELREAEQTYPAEWIEDAFREAVEMNKRSWRYARAILERWRKDGRGETSGRRSAASDRQRYSRWKTG
jgi:DNA replication protein